MTNATGTPTTETAAVAEPGANVVPEKAPKIASRNWATILQAAQVASTAALTIGYLHP